MNKLTSVLTGGAIAIGLALSANAATLKMAYDADPVSLDPHEQLSGGTLQLSHMVFDPLIRWTQELGFEGRLAESWERVDEHTVRFNLRKGVKFHSGNPMTAADVLWTYNRLKSSPDFKGIFEQFKNLNVIDEHSFELVTKGEYPLVLHTATYIFPMDSQFYTGTDEKGEPKDKLVKHAATYASTHVSGTGAYTVSSREQGVKIVFNRSSTYWDTTSKGNVDKIILTPIKEAPTRVAALLSGDVDFITPVPPNDHNRIKASDKVDLVTLPGTRIITFQMNQQRKKEFRDVRVRQAIVHAINNEGIVQKIMKGFATTAAQQGPIGYAGFKANLTPRYDLKKAKTLMKQAGLEKGFSVTMMAPNNRYVNDKKIAQAVVSMLAKINIKVNLKAMPKAQYWPEFDKRSADLMMIGWHSDTEDSANFSEFLITCPNKDTGAGQYNSGNYCNPKVDELVKASATQTDSAKRAALLQEVEQILYEDAAFIPLHWQNLAWAARKGVNIASVVNVQNFPYLSDLVIDEK